ncbi:MAG TPA: adenosylcobinamide-GDP ribazoletransferase, partial [Nocardioides sp.]|uniref:adenosylcobinamide-GDP ribazoletransferase n=1 Tax=Nocardioides sp. TaxID=35761 RepID=UPI002D80945C
MNALRLAFGTLTVLPVRPPTVDRGTAGRAMALAPLVGLVLGVVACLPLLLTETSPLLCAVATIGALALLTRGLHLDGLADTADGLGSGRPAADALAVMRKGDVGPFGVVTLVVVLLAQVAALAQLVAEGAGAAALVASLVVSRLALPLACLRGVPAARADGLGAAVAGSVSRPAALVAVLLTAIPVVVLALLVDDAVAWAPLGLLAGAALGWRAVRRLGGVTGDVLGAVVEATFTASLVLLC